MAQFFCLFVDSINDNYYRIINLNTSAFFYSDLSTTNVSRPLSAPVISSSTIVGHTHDRSKDTSIINTDVTVSLKKNRSGEDKGTILFVINLQNNYYQLLKWC